MEFNGTFLATIISFLLFVYLMNKLLYAPMEKIVTERNEFINNNLKQANENDTEADRLLQEKEEKLSNAKQEAKIQFVSTVDKYKDDKNKQIAQVQQEVENHLQEQYKQLENLSNETKEGLKSKITDLANDIVEKVIGYRSEVQNFDNDKVNNIFYHQEG